MLEELRDGAKTCPDLRVRAGRGTVCTRLLLRVERIDGGGATRVLRGELGLRRAGHVEAAAAWRSAGVRSSSFCRCLVGEVEIGRKLQCNVSLTSALCAPSLPQRLSTLSPHGKRRCRLVIGWCESDEIGDGETEVGGVLV